MKNKKGFTLLELLVAATIVGIMAVFATTSYRNSAADSRMTAAKARTDALAVAVQRMRIEYPSSTAEGQMQDSTSAVCNWAAPSGLVSCGFIENGGWEKDGYVTYWVCNGKSGSCANSPVANPLACMLGRDVSKQVKRYKSGYIYCVSETAKGEKLAG